MLGDEWTRWGGCVVLGVIGVDLTSMYRMDWIFTSIPALPHQGGRDFVSEG